MKVYQNSVECKLEGRSIKCTIKGFVKFSDGKKVNITSTSMANCHPDDEFDYTVGSRIAESRASLGFYKQAERSVEDYITKKTADMDDDLKRAVHLINKEKLHLTGLIKDVQ